MVVRRIQVVLFVLLAVAAVLLVYYALHTGGSYRPSSTKATTSPSTSVAAPAARMLVIGDSSAAGEGASRVRKDWVSRVARGTGWKVTNVSVAGAGYLPGTSTAGTCEQPRCPSLDTLLKRAHDVPRPDVVLVAAGRDDLSSFDRDLRPATRSFFQALHRAYPEATIVAVNPRYDVPLASPSTTFDDDVRSGVQRVGGVYANLGQPLVDHSDRVTVGTRQPNDQGHRAIARAVLTALRASNSVG
jgi:lysophospholipase L1-like esterase